TSSTGTTLSDGRASIVTSSVSGRTSCSYFVHRLAHPETGSSRRLTRSWNGRASRRASLHRLLETRLPGREGSELLVGAVAAYVQSRRFHETSQSGFSRWRAVRACDACTRTGDRRRYRRSVERPRTIFCLGH